MIRNKLCLFINKHIKISNLILCVFLYFGSYCYAEDDKKITIVYFYTSVCERCNEVEKILEEFDDVYRSISLEVKPHVRMHNIAESFMELSGTVVSADL